MAYLSYSLPALAGMLSVLLVAGWLLYVVLENVQESAKGMSIEAGMAERKAKTEERRTAMIRRRAKQAEILRKNAEATSHPKPVRLDTRLFIHDAAPVRRSDAGRHSETRIRRLEKATAAGAEKAFRFYPRIVYQCPYATSAHSQTETGSNDSGPVISRSGFAGEVRKTG